MAKIGRNDLCTCGSGKKYKKCCGKNKTVVSMEHLIEKELSDIQMDIIKFAMKNHQEEIDSNLGKYLKEYDVPKEVKELYYFFNLLWFITSVELKGKTIIAEYIDEHIHTINREKIKDSLQTWRNVTPSVFKIQQQMDNDYVFVRDIFTNEITKVKVLEEEHNIEPEGMILGTILTAGEESFFFATFLDMPASASVRIEEGILDLYKRSGKATPIHFMSSSFLEVLDYFLFGQVEVSIDDLEWIAPQHKEVAVDYQEYMKAYPLGETATEMGILLWHKYCMMKKPSIKKSAIYEAALVYLVDRILSVGGSLTQKKLADDFNVSSSSISSKFKDLEYVLSDEIKKLHDKLELDEFNSGEADTINEVLG